MILGIDPQPRRLGIAVIREGGPAIGAWNECYTMSLDVTGGGWPWEQISRALAKIEAHGEPSIVGIEDAVQGAINRTTLASHAETRAWVLEHIITRWPHLTADEIVWWHPAKPGPGTKAERTTLWRAWAGVGYPWDKLAVLERAKGLGFKPTTQDEADAACIAWATWKKFQ